MSNHQESSQLRKRVFETVRDCPNLCSTEIAELLDLGPDSSVTAYLTQLFDANMVTRCKKTVANPPESVHATRTVYHYYTTVAEYRWERKKPGPKAARKVRPEGAVPGRAPIVRVEKPTDLALPPPPVVNNDKAANPVKDILTQIENMRYGDVKILKAEIDRMFA